MAEQAMYYWQRPLKDTLSKVIQKETFKLKPMVGSSIKIFDGIDTANPIQVPKLSF